MAIFAIIGLGSFGTTVATELMKLEHDVIGIDINKRYVENIANNITHAVIADATDEHVLEELNIQNCDAVIVAIGEDIEASVLCVLNLKNLGVKRIWGKAKTKSHHTILSHLHIEKIIHPEEDMGIRVAQALNYPMVSRYMALNDDHYIIQIPIPENFHRETLNRFLAKSPLVKPLLIKRLTHIFYQIEPDITLASGDILILEGPLPQLKKVCELFI
ncbi:TrkA family potassium uptake protein [Acinetobacter lactucae]|uniref:potassium channel family protein n=1 Tax=Acinetobacter lactucae TaxID=1785128 RepID=UPI00358DCC4A